MSGHWDTLDVFTGGGNAHTGVDRTESVEPGILEGVPDGEVDSGAGEFGQLARLRLIGMRFRAGRDHDGDCDMLTADTLDEIPLRRDAHRHPHLARGDNGYERRNHHEYGEETSLETRMYNPAISHYALALFI